VPYRTSALLRSSNVSTVINPSLDARIDERFCRL
jgi:hypothetical protein